MVCRPNIQAFYFWGRTGFNKTGCIYDIEYFSPCTGSKDNFKLRGFKRRIYIYKSHMHDDGDCKNVDA